MFRPALALAFTGTLAFAATLSFQMEMPKPTQEHAMLQKGVGTWEGTVTMSVPGMPEEPVPAKETVTAHGPFWILFDFRSEFMGMPYRGHGCQGYDPEKGKYMGTWLDNTSSFLSVMEGDYDEETGKLVMTWDAPDMTGKVVPHRSEMEMEDDAYTMQFFTGGQKTMVIEMERTSAKPTEASATER